MKKKIMFILFLALIIVFIKYNNVYAINGVDEWAYSVNNVEVKVGNPNTVIECYKGDTVYLRFKVIEAGYDSGITCYPDDNAFVLIKHEVMPGCVHIFEYSIKITYEGEEKKYEFTFNPSVGAFDVIDGKNAYQKITIQSGSKYKKILKDMEEQSSSAKGNLDNISGLYNQLLCMGFWAKENGNGGYTVNFKNIKNPQKILNELKKSNDEDIKYFRQDENLSKIYNSVINMLNSVANPINSSDPDSELQKATDAENSSQITTGAQEADRTIREIIAKEEAKNRKENDVFYDVFENLEEYDPTKTPTINSPKAVSMASTVLSVITSIGIVLSVLIPAIVGVKYMFSSIEGKAEYKKDMIPYLVGAILLFGISTIVKVMQNIGQSINNM